ncbi:N-acetylmuramoyl-L-alanine amidase [Candidatus Chloroploca asiatica]|uniref:Peptidoglycan recognition protein family domain-containing protein n=1 Tax=Candidatus Chloroploca asiatica TaxID=1506545 RepID=A0A2H3LAT6_9CHLR|nr:N-acetylmuramoyl-L-alanine amidase [Candidatus Chloroploca asiatica]PDW00588.1 hypothetical protein A9Q02_09365 [Candidatus Chloroploca asiatica]
MLLIWLLGTVVTVGFVSGLVGMTNSRDRVLPAIPSTTGTTAPREPDQMSAVEVQPSPTSFIALVRTPTARRTPPAVQQPDQGVPHEPVVQAHVSVPKPAIVSRASWGAVDPMADLTSHQPQQITLHHEGVLFDGSVPAPEYLRRVQRWSLDNRGWPDIPYHFIIDLEGTIYEGRMLAAQGSSNTDYDLRGHIHIALLGKYDAGEQEPNSAQITAIIELMAWIAATYHLAPDTIHGHRDFIPLNARGEHIDPRTGSLITCPGDNLYRYLEDGTLQRGVAARLTQAYLLSASRHTAEQPVRQQGDGHLRGLTQPAKAGFVRESRGVDANGMGGWG